MTVESFLLLFFFNVHVNITCCQAHAELFLFGPFSCQTQMTASFGQFLLFSRFSTALTCCVAAKGLIKPSVKEVQLFLQPADSHCGDGLCKDLHSGLRQSTETRIFSPPLTSFLSLDIQTQTHTEY